MVDEPLRAGEPRPAHVLGTSSDAMCPRTSCRSSAPQLLRLVSATRRRNTLVASLTLCLCAIRSIGGTRWPRMMHEVRVDHGLHVSFCAPTCRARIREVALGRSWQLSGLQHGTETGRERTADNNEEECRCLEVGLRRRIDRQLKRGRAKSN